jgi:hypothetical protein
MSRERIEELLAELTMEMHAYLQASSGETRQIRMKRMLATASTLVFFKSGKNSISWNREDEALVQAAIESGIKKQDMTILMDYVILALDTLAGKKAEEWNQKFNNKQSGDRGR